MKKLTILGAAMVAGMFLAGAAMAADKAPAAAGTNQTATVKAQTLCPVMDGSPINKDLYTDYNGKRVYFCCGACPKLFAKDPEKYMKKMEKAGIVLEDAPKKDVAK